MNNNPETSFDDRFDKALSILEERILNLLHICTNKEEIKKILQDLTPQQMNAIYAEALKKEMYEICQAVKELHQELQLEPLPR